MPGFSIEVPHELGQQQASGRLRGFLDKVRERYQSQVIDLEETWTENNLNFGFKTYGISVQGNVDVQPEAVKVAGKLPLARNHEYEPSPPVAPHVGRVTATRKSLNVIDELHSVSARV